MNLSDIKFPVFRLGEEEPTIKDGVCFYLLGNTSEEEYVIKVVDDINLPHDTLGLRRLQLKSQGVQLRTIGTAVFYIGDFIKLAKSTTWFIDSVGKVFQYKKATRVKLIYREIEFIAPVTSGGALIGVKGINCRFKTLHMPVNKPTHAGLLVLKTSYILYGLYDKAYDPSYRVI